MAVHRWFFLLFAAYLAPSSSVDTDRTVTGVGENFVVFPGNTACSDFEDLVTKSGHLWLLLFKKAYCPWCKEFDFEWQAASFDLRSSPRVRFAEVDIHRCGAIAAKYGARNAPTTVLVSGENFETYTGPKSASGLVSAANMALKRWRVDLIGHFDDKVPIKIVDSTSLDVDILTNDKPTLLMVSSRWPPPPALLDRRIRDFGILPAFASHDVQLQSRLELMFTKSIDTLKALEEALIESKNKNSHQDQEASNHSTSSLSNSSPNLEELKSWVVELEDSYETSVELSKGKASRKKKEANKQQDVYLFPPLLHNRFQLPTRNRDMLSTSSGVEAEPEKRRNFNDIPLPYSTHHQSISHKNSMIPSNLASFPCDDSCRLWELDIHALNIRNKPSAAGSVVGVAKKGQKFYASCDLSPSSSLLSVLPSNTSSSSGEESISVEESIPTFTSLLNPNCMWLRMCPCEMNDAERDRLFQRNIPVQDVVSSAKDHFITRFGDVSDTSSLRVVLADTDRIIFQVKPPQHQVATRGAGASSQSSGLVSSIGDWIYSHMSLWYVDVASDEGTC